MKQADAEYLARELMDLWLKDPTWRFEWMRSRTVFGRCRREEHCLYLSGPLTDVNDVDQVRDTILHEVAHANVGIGHGHDRVWKLEAIRVGAKPVRGYRAGDEVTMPPSPYVLQCVKGCSIPKYRRTNAAYICRKHLITLELVRT